VLKLEMQIYTLKAFIYEICEAIKERALEAKKEKDEAEKHKDNDKEEYMYAVGRLMVFNEVISIIKQTAEPLGIDLKELKLDDIDPDKI
jgi:DNA-binding NtrC family response regulator